MEHVDRVAIAPLKARYGHRKFYTEYIPLLSIQIQRDGKNGFVSQHEAQLLERYHEARGRGKEAATEFLEQLEYVPSLDKPSVLEHVPTRTNTYSSLADDISRLELLKLAGTLQDINPVARWLITAWVLETVAMQQIVIIRSVLLVLLDREKLPRMRRFRARGFEFWRVDDRSGNEWLAKLADNTSTV